MALNHPTATSHAPPKSSVHHWYSPVKWPSACTKMVRKKS